MFFLAGWEVGDPNYLASLFFDYYDAFSGEKKLTSYGTAVQSNGIFWVAWWRGITKILRSFCGEGKSYRIVFNFRHLSSI